MTLEEAINHAEEVAVTSCDECREEHEQLAAWLKELKRIKEDSIIIPNTSTVWEVAKALIDARGKVKTWSGNYQIQNLYDTDEIASIGKHLMNYVNVEDSETYYEYWKQ